MQIADPLSCIFLSRFNIILRSPRGNTGPRAPGLLITRHETEPGPELR